MTEKKKVKLLEFGKANVNGKVYLAEEFECPKVLSIVLTTTNNMGVPFNEEVGRAEITRSMQVVEAEITFFTASAGGKRAQDLVENEGHQIVASGVGQIDENGYIRNYTMHRCLVTNEPANTY